LWKSQHSWLFLIGAGKNYLRVDIQALLPDFKVDLHDFSYDSLES
jgi:hypothetical protein